MEGSREIWRAVDDLLPKLLAIIWTEAEREQKDLHRMSRLGFLLVLLFFILQLALWSSTGNTCIKKNKTLIIFFIKRNLRREIYLKYELQMTGNYRLRKASRRDHLWMTLWALWQRGNQE